MAANGGISLLPLLSLLFLLGISSTLAKHHHEPRSDISKHKMRNENANFESGVGRPSNENAEEAPSGYCSKTDRKMWTNGWANTTMDIQYTKTVKIETSKEGKLREGTRKIRERYRRSAKETPAEKKKRKRKNKKARKDKKHKQAKTEATQQAQDQKSQQQQDQKNQQQQGQTQKSRRKRNPSKL